MASTKKEKVYLVYEETYRKGVSIPLSDIENIIKDKGRDKISVELIKVGKMSDESEFLTIKIKVKK